MIRPSFSSVSRSSDQCSADFCGSDRLAAMVQDERFLDGRQAGIHVEPTRGDHVLLREVEEIDRHSGKIRSGSHARVPEPRSLGADATPFPLSSLLTTMYSVVGRLILNAVAARRTITDWRARTCRRRGRRGTRRDRAAS